MGKKREVFGLIIRGSKLYQCYSSYLSIEFGGNI